MPTNHTFCTLGLDFVSWIRRSSASLRTNSLLYVSWEREEEEGKGTICVKFGQQSTTIRRRHESRLGDCDVLARGKSTET